MKKRKSYSGEFKAEVVLDYMMGKRTLQELADKYQVHPNQIKNWKSVFIKNAALIMEDKRKHKGND